MKKVRQTLFSHVVINYCLCMLGGRRLYMSVGTCVNIKRKFNEKMSSILNIYLTLKDKVNIDSAKPIQVP